MHAIGSTEQYPTSPGFVWSAKVEPWRVFCSYTLPDVVQTTAHAPGAHEYVVQPDGLVPKRETTALYLVEGMPSALAYCLSADATPLFRAPPSFRLPESGAEVEELLAGAVSATIQTFRESNS
jgi:hypothetical protein